jgi:hypothetical protein
MNDLIYAGADAERSIAGAFPDARIEDASDFIHEERFSVTLPDALEDTYLKHVIANGLGSVSLSVQLMLLDDGGRKKLRALLPTPPEAPHDGASTR